MIASYKLFLPYVFHVLKPDELTPYHTTVDRFEVTLYPPLQATVETVSFGGRKQVAHSLLPASPQVPSDDIKVFDQDTLEANLLKIDFKRRTSTDGAVTNKKTRRWLLSSRLQTAGLRCSELLSNLPAFDQLTQPSGSGDWIT